MKSYELQTYQNGAWQFDAYFDSRDLVVSEAERMDQSNRYVGVRVLEEVFDEDRQSSKYQTIFSRLKKAGNSGVQRKSPGAAGSGAAPGSVSVREPAKASRRGPAKKKSGRSVTWLLFGGIGLAVLGIFAIIVLREIAGSA